MLLRLLVDWLVPSYSPTLITENGLEEVTKNTWRSYSVDPSFNIHLGVLKPRNWYMFELKITSDVSFFTSKIYIDVGCGYEEPSHLPIHSRSGSLSKRIVFIPRNTKRLRFDPCESTATFSIEKIKLTKLTQNRARELMLKKLNYISQESIETTYENYCRLFIEKNKSTNYLDWLESRCDHNIMLRADSQRDRTILPISLLLTTYNSNIIHLQSCINSVLAQIYPHWQLCIADDASTDGAVSETLLHYSQQDSRIRVVQRSQNGHISQASNSALSLATGDYIALLDHDDLLSPFALQCMVNAISHNPDAALLYSDEDKIDERGERFSPHFKPDWNRDLFYSHNYITHFAVIKKSEVDRVGGFRTGVEGSQDYDLFLRLIANLADKQIVHVPHVLYHWRAIQGSTALSADQKDYTSAAGLNALQDYFSASHLDLAVSQHQLNNCYRVQWPLPQPAPLVSLIVPTRDGVDLLKQCIDSILQKTTYRQFEIIVVNNQSSCRRTLAYLHQLANTAQVRVIDFDQLFNFSAINNLAVSHAKGSIIGLINNDIEVINPGWLEEMVRQVSRPDIGCVGAKLYYPDGRIQHAGVVLGIGGVAGHSHKYFAPHHHGYHSRLALVQNYSAVTGAALLVRKSVYQEVGGLETDLAVAFNDIDFCLKVREAGYRNLWTPFAELTHHESVSRGHEDSPEKQARFQREAEYMKSKWGDLLLNDPCYNPNLTLQHEDFSLRI